ncbi:MAG: hypothetical protein ACP5K9_01200 [Candidatus Micrarchaeia archaeon]
MLEVIDPIIKKYNLPPWVKLYAAKYIKKNPSKVISAAFGFVNYGRKKGAISGGKIILPNKYEFDIDTVAYISELFLYGDRKLAEIATIWSSRQMDPYKDHYAKLSKAYESDAHAINSLLEGLKKKPNFEPTKELEELFAYIKGIDNAYMRIVALDFIIKYAYAKTFGSVFFKAFYPVSPEFMRQLKSVLNYNSGEFSFGEAEAMRIIKEKVIPETELLESAKRILMLICNSIKSEMQIAKKAGIATEISLLGEVSIAYPLHIIADAGVSISPDAEAESIFSQCGWQ